MKHYKAPGMLKLNPNGSRIAVISYLDKDNEGFTKDYDLTNDTAYCETCAAAGMVFWNHRMFLLHRKSINTERPLVYCFEEADNKQGFSDISIPGDPRFTVEYEKDLLGGVVAVSMIHSDKNIHYKAVPYCAWDNREPGSMLVWLPEENEEEKHQLRKLKNLMDYSFIYDEVKETYSETQAGLRSVRFVCSNTSC